MRIPARSLALLVGLLLSPLSFAESRFVRIPGSAAPVELRVAEYQGGTNGELTVDVRNSGAQPAEFDAEGLYFVPAGNPDEAPQRLGAVGPFQQRAGSSWERKRTLALKPGEQATIKLDVYCIDSHRRSPRTGDRFHLAQTRMPKTLASEIRKNADQAAQSVSGGYAAPAAKASVQSEVWKARDKKWLKLDGEGKQEAAK